MNSKILLVVSMLIIGLPLSVYALEGTISVNVDGSTFDIAYDAVGVNVIGLEADLAEIELLFEVEVTEDPATLEITFERSFFDAKFGEDDDEFFVIADGDFLDLVEIETTSESRTLQLDLPLGTEEIEIFGTILSGATYGEPVVEEPPVEEPPVEEPPVEEPPVEEPPVEDEEVMEEEVMEEESKTQCGPGTVLKGGECVLEDTCGAGTHLEDGECVLDRAPSSSSSGDRPAFSQLIYGAAAALVIAFAVIIILWIISRGSREKINA